MTTDDRSLERAARSWLEAGPTKAPDRAVDDALDRIQTMSQERALPVPWRLPGVGPLGRFAAAVVALALVIGGTYLVARSLPSTGGPAPTVEGRWEVTFTRAEMLAAGLTAADEDAPSSYGTFVLTLAGGQGTFVQQDGPKVSGGGAYAIDAFGENLTLCPVNGPPFTMPFTVTQTTLTFGRGGPVWFRVKPWTRIGPAAGLSQLPSLGPCPPPPPSPSPAPSPSP